MDFIHEEGCRMYLPKIKERMCSVVEINSYNDKKTKLLFMLHKVKREKLQEDCVV